MDEDAFEAAEEGEGEGEGAPESAPAPRQNALLLGHESAEAALLQAYRSGRLPHAWLIAGPRGIGKATLAFRFARFLLSEGARIEGSPPLTPTVSPRGEGETQLASSPSPPRGEGRGEGADAGAHTLALATDHPLFRRVASGGHADLLVVERGLDPRRKRMRGEIVVEDTRAIAAFLRLTPAEGRWRVVIVDDADLMNRNAANALLKILEEPPQKAMLLLVSDNPGRLLPTIRSRCRSLVLKPLPVALVREALERYRGDLAPGERAALAELAQGSIGRALELAGAGGLDLYRALLRLIERLPQLDGTALHALADRLARGDGEDAFRMTAELLPGWLARMVALAAGGGAEAGAVPGEAETMRRLAARRALDQWVEVWEKLTHLFALADSVNLDRKQVVLNAFFALAEAAR